MSEQQRQSAKQGGVDRTRPAPLPNEDSSRSTPSTGLSSVPTRGVATSSSTPQTPHTPTDRSSAAATQFRVPQSPHESAGGMSQSQGEPSSKAAKVAIPRLKRSLDSGDSNAKGNNRHRVTHACEPCRHRKTKCSGERPTCRHCQDFKIACYYADGKRDRVKK